MRFYLDENLSTKIAEIARGLNLDALSAAELGQSGLTDEEQLRLAARAGRCIVTADLDFIELTKLFAETGQPHTGVLIMPPTWSTAQFARIARAMAAYAERYTGGSPDYLLDYLR